MTNTSVNPMLMSDAEFASWRQIGDDHIGSVALVVLSMFDQEYIYDTFTSLVKNSDKLVIDEVKFNKKTWDVPEESLATWKVVGKTFLEEYFDDLPVDQKGRPRKQLFQFTPDELVVLNKATRFFCTHMTEATLALGLRSLLKQYAAYNATNVLVYTKLLPKYPHRRILATFQFVMDVMDINAFSPEGRGVKAIQKLRLVHSMIRTRIEGLSKDPDVPFEWKEQEWGVPINQQDMVFAIHTFSIEVIKGILATGEKIAQVEIDNYYLAWHYIGRALGIKPEINPSDYLIGCQVQDRIYAKEFIKNNPNAIVLAEPLIQFFDESFPLCSRKAVLGMVRLFNDKKDFQPIFQDILKLDLNSAQRYYAVLYRIADFLKDFNLHLQYKFLPKSRHEDFVIAIAKRQHRFFEFIMSFEKTWDANQFRIADGFGEKAAQTDEEKEKKLPLIHRFFDKLLKSKLGRWVFDLYHKFFPHK